MYYRSSNSAKAGPSAQDSSPRKKHDVGLSAKERIFVHALRNLFDPKGKSSAEVLQSPKGIVSQPPRTSHDREVTFRRQTGQLKKKKENLVKRKYANEHLPPVSILPQRWVHPASKRIRRKAGKTLVSENPTGSAAKQSVGSKSSKGPAVGGSPPIVDASRSVPVSTSSAVKHKSPSRIRRAEMRAKSLARGVIVGAGRSNPTSLKQDPAVKREARENKRLGGAVDRLGEYVHPADELEVVKAFGGADALRELCKFERRRERLVFPSVVYRSPLEATRPSQSHVLWNQRTTDDCIPIVTISKATRDYTKVTLGMRGVFQKPRQFPALKAALEKELASQGKRSDKGKSTKKNKSPSQVRREKRRAEGRTSKVSESSAVKQEPELPETVEVKISPFMHTGKCISEWALELRVWEDMVAKVRRGESVPDEESKRKTLDIVKSTIKIQKAMREDYQEAKLGGSLIQSMS